MNETEIRALWTYAGRMWQSFDAGDPGNGEEVCAVDMEVWRRNLGDLDYGAIRSALDALGGEKWPPPVGMIRVKALEMRKQAAGWVPAPTPDRAWAEVRESFQYRYDWDRKPPWSHPAVLETVRSMGWAVIADSENPETTRAHFVRFYEMAAARHDHAGEPDAPGVVAYLDAHRPPAALASGE